MTEINGNIISALPTVLLDDNTYKALAEIASELLTECADDVEKISIYGNIDKLPSEALDALAIDFGVKWYNTAFSLAEKRSTIKSAFAVHMKKGTPYAVEMAIGSIFPGAKVKEYFDYSGTPGHFKVTIYASSSDTEKQALVVAAIKYYKNLTSVLDEIIYITPVEGTAKLYTGAKMTGTHKKVSMEVKNYVE